MDDDQQFCLRWNNHQSTLISVFDTLLENETLVDCTLAAEGKFLKAHKVVLSACSPYFATLLSEQYDKHPIFILKDVKYQELRAMMDYMYRGEVNISQDQLAALLKAAESLQIKGLSDNRTGSGSSSSGLGGVVSQQQQQQQQQQKSSAEQHKHISVPGKLLTGASAVAGGYTLEQTKRARIGPSSIDSQDLSGSREGSSSPTARRRKKVRRRSIDNVLGDNHDNSNSSQIQAGTSSIVPTTNATGAIAAMVPVVGGGSGVGQTSTIAAANIPTSSALLAGSASAANIITANVTKKTESVKMGNTDAMNTAAAIAEHIQDENAADSADKDMMIKEKQNHKRSKQQQHHHDGGSSAGKDSDIVIEPKSEYDEEGNDETVEDLTLDDEEMGLEDLDQNAGPSHGGEGSSQGYAQWQVDRSQDEVFLAAQEAQQRDPQDNNCLPPSGSTVQNETSTIQKAAQSESRIRVRNWLMLADQSILQKSIVNHAMIPIPNEPTNPDPTNRKNNNELSTNKTNNNKTIVTDSNGTLSIGVGNTGEGMSIYDAADEDTTEVIVKIERSNSSMGEESENEDPFNYDLKISSPMSWAFDSVKIEGSEFDEGNEMDQDENTADVDRDDCGDGEMDMDACEEAMQAAANRRHNTRRIKTGTGKHRSIVRKREQMNMVSVGLNLPPETTVTTATSNMTMGKMSAGNMGVANATAISMSNDKKYRILIQNQRMRKESLEHSEDMIYNADIEKPWVCKNCNRNYKWKNSLKCHLKNECGQPPRFFCSKLCGYATNVHSNLKRHLNTKCRDKLDDEPEKSPEKPDKTHYTLLIKKHD